MTTYAQLTRVFALLFLILLVASPFMGAQDASDIDVRAASKNMEQRFKNCPRRELVSELDGKHHKKVWQKQAWGPPTGVFVDVKANDSVLYPYILIVEFSLRHAFGPERQNKADAEKDSDLSAYSSVAPLLTGRYRNVYSVGKDGIRLKSREVLDRKLDGTAATWQEKPEWLDACWDQIGAK